MEASVAESSPFGVRPAPLRMGRAITVVDRERLAALASFDGNYLNMPQLLSHWQVKIEPLQAQAERSPAMASPSSAARPRALRTGAGCDAAAPQTRRACHRADRLIATGAFADYLFRGSE